MFVCQWNLQTKSSTNSQISSLTKFKAYLGTMSIKAQRYASTWPCLRQVRHHHRDLTISSPSLKQQCLHPILLITQPRAAVSISRLAQSLLRFRVFLVSADSAVPLLTAAVVTLPAKRGKNNKYSTNLCFRPTITARLRFNLIAKKYAARMCCAMCRFCSISTLLAVLCSRANMLSKLYLISPPHLTALCLVLCYLLISVCFPTPTTHHTNLLPALA